MKIDDVNPPRALPLLIGQAPSGSTRQDMPLYPVPARATGGRLQLLMGLNRAEYLSRFDRINLLPYFPGGDKGGDKFPMSPAKLAVAAILPMLAGRTVILVGRGVADAFGFDEEWHHWVKWRPMYRPDYQHFNPKGVGVMAAVPHPSGRNRWYNEPGNMVVAAAFWSKFLSVS